MRSHSPAVSGQSQSATIVEIFPGATLRPRVPPIRMPARLTTAKGALNFGQRWEAKLRAEAEARLIAEHEQLKEKMAATQEEVRDLAWNRKVDAAVHSIMVVRRHRGPMRPPRVPKSTETGGLSPDQIATLDALLARAEGRQT